jgi:2-haloacid dehalogenase
MKWFLENVCTSEWNLEQDTGRTIAEGVAIKIAEFPEYETEIKLFYKDWEYMFSGIIEENVQLFQQLKANKNFKVYALTNWCAEKWDKALELFPFFNEFDGVVVSGQEKCRKPFPEIYNILFNRFQITPENAIFIDDNLDNIIAARQLNLNGIHFTNNTNLKEVFNSFEIDL